MAATNFFTYPLDVPHIEGPGFVHRESAAPGNDSHQYVPPEHAIRREKGDIGLSVIKDFDPRSLTAGGVPWKNMKGGR
jgi:hypothetical protein